jgi:hypothetical protein
MAMAPGVTKHREHGRASRTRAGDQYNEQRERLPPALLNIVKVAQSKHTGKRAWDMGPLELYHEGAGLGHAEQELAAPKFEKRVEDSLVRV